MPSIFGFALGHDDIIFFLGELPKLFLKCIFLPQQAFFISFKNCFSIFFSSPSFFKPREFTRLSLTPSSNASSKKKPWLDNVSEGEFNLDILSHVYRNYDHPLSLGNELTLGPFVFEILKWYYLAGMIL